MIGPEDFDYVIHRVEKLSSAFVVMQVLIGAGELSPAEDLSSIFGDYTIETLDLLKALAAAAGGDHE